MAFSSKVNMNVQYVHTALDYGANCGNTLSNEQCVVVHTYLIILQNENHFVQILGLDNVWL
jgi:hypothetical protein